MSTEGDLASKPHRKACRRYNDVGQAHGLTFSCFQRRPFLKSGRACPWMADAIELARRKHDFDLWAYVFMPEHVHLLIVPNRAEYDVSAILSTMKQSISKRAILWVKDNAPGFLPRMTERRPGGRSTLRFWQAGGGYDRNLWSPRYIWETIEYIHDNPVRRGLCDVPVDWEWSSAAAYAGKRDGPLVIDMGSLPRDARR